MPSQFARSVLAAAAIGGSFFACQTPYVKEGATAKDLEHDKYACSAQSQAGVGGYAVPRDQALFAKCMESRGWTRSTKEPAQEAQPAPQ